jgi:uncharacterized protein YceH (UPF0502 family)
MAPHPSFPLPSSRRFSGRILFPAKRWTRQTQKRMETETQHTEGLLSALAGRVLGCLIEKETATPDVYPLTLNALTNACNQRSNRSPVMSAQIREVELAVQELRLRRMAVQVTGGDSRVEKYRHRLPETLELTVLEQTLLCELLVRGPQTAAGLRANCERLRPVPEDVESVLVGLAARASGALVAKMERQTGQKEARWRQLLAAEAAGTAGEVESVSVTVALPESAEKRIADLEAEVAQLRLWVQEMRRELGLGDGAV